MACSLKKSGLRQFTAKVGNQVTVTVTVKGPKTAGAKIMEIRYSATSRDTEVPFQFNVKDGKRPLVVVVTATRPGAKLKLLETCPGGSEQKLKGFTYDPATDSHVFYIKGE